MPHIHEKVDFTSEVYVVYQNKVLLRKHDKFGIWLSVGGHIELDEDPNQAAIREVKEEVGLDVTLDDSLKPDRPFDETTELIPPYYLNMQQISETHRHITFVYFARAQTDRLSFSGHDKSEECKWFTKKEIERATELRANVKFYALKALEKLSD